MVKFTVIGEWLHLLQGHIDEVIGSRMEGSKCDRKIFQKCCLIWSFKLENERERSSGGRAFQIRTSYSVEIGVRDATSYELVKRCMYLWTSLAVEPDLVGRDENET